MGVLSGARKDAGKLPPGRDVSRLIEALDLSLEWGNAVLARCETE